MSFSSGHKELAIKTSFYERERIFEELILAFIQAVMKRLEKREISRDDSLNYVNTARKKATRRFMLS